MNIGKKILISTALCLGFVSNVYGGQINVKLNGKEISSRALLSEDRTLIPFRDIFENLGYDVRWDNGKIYASNGKTSMELAVGSRDAVIADYNGEKTVDCGAEVILINDSAYVPVRTVAETDGAVVEWNENGKTVDIYTRENILNDGGQEKIQLKYPVRYSFDDKDLKYIEKFIEINIDPEFKLENFKISENSLVTMNGDTIFGVVSLNYLVNGFESDIGYDFEVQSGYASKLIINGSCSMLKETEPPVRTYTDEELCKMALEDGIKLAGSERISEQRVLRKYKDGKYIYGVVTEITSDSDISRAEYFEFEV